MRILVTDDQATIRHAMCLILKRLGFTDIVEADDGYSALNQLKKGKFDLIISDVHMPAPVPGAPAKSGLDLLEAVRLDPKFKKIPFLIVSSDADMKTVVKAMQRGVNGYIIKPFTEKSVREKLNMLGFKTRDPEPEPEPQKNLQKEKPSAVGSDKDFLVTKF